MWLINQNKERAIEVGKGAGAGLGVRMKGRDEGMETFNIQLTFCSSAVLESRAGFHSSHV